MGIIWDKGGSKAMQTAMETNLDVWEKGLTQWKTRLEALKTVMGTGPNAQLSGKAWQTTKTLFIDRILPIITTGIAACSSTRDRLSNYASFERPLIQAATHLEEDALQIARDKHQQNVYEWTHWGPIPTPWHDDDDRVARERVFIRILDEKLAMLRLFARQVNGLFDKEKNVAGDIETAVSSIRRGKIGEDGVYRPHPGDNEKWRESLAEYRRTHKSAGPFILGNVRWPETMPDDFLEIRAIAEESLRKAMEDSDLTPEQIQQALDYIAYKLAVAPEPFKHLMIEIMSEVRVSNTTGQEYYLAGVAHVNMRAGLTDPRGPYATLFHELGHGIYDNKITFGGVSPNYEVDGDYLSETIKDDVRANLNQVVLKYTSDPEQQLRVTNAIMNKTTWLLSPEDKAILADVEQAYKTALNGPTANVASDVYGGATGNVLNGNYGHPTAYWIFVRPPAWEFWAGYVSDQIIGDPGLTTTQNYLPSTAALADRLAESM